MTSRLWPWSSGAPVEEQPSRLEAEMSPDPQGDSEAYDLRPAPQQATAGEARPAQQAGAGSQRPTRQPS